MRSFSFRAGRRTGAARQAGSYVLAPESFVVEIGWPGGGYVWNWPVALWVIDGSRTQHIAVVDVTRLAVWGIYLAAFLFVLALGRRSNQHE